MWIKNTRTSTNARKNSPSLVIDEFCTNCKKVFKAIGFKNKNDLSIELCVLARESEKNLLHEEIKSA